VVSASPLVKEKNVVGGKGNRKGKTTAGATEGRVGGKEKATDGKWSWMDVS